MKGNTLDPQGWPLIRVLGPQFGDTIYISKVNGARKVKFAGSYEQELRPRAEYFLGVAGEDGAPTQLFVKLLELSEMSQARKLIFGLQVNIDKATSHMTFPVDCI